VWSNDCEDRASDRDERGATGSWARCGAQPIDAERYLDRPVWVDLDVLYGPAGPDSPATGPLHEGLVLSGRVPGVLKLWARAIDGRWTGIVDFAIHDRYGAVVVQACRVVVPAAALAPQPPPAPPR
jgi:hypothetical protein